MPVIFCNANIITMDPFFPFAEWILVSEGKIQAIGRADAYRQLESAGTTVFDCRGRTVLPGLIDAHLHLAAFAERCVSVDLSGFTSISEIQKAIKVRCQKTPPGAWIRAKGYNEFYLAEKRHPNRHDLDEAAPLHPVKLTHRSGHAHVLNTAALAFAGISPETEDPPGGLIERDLATGAPTGLLYEMGAYLSKRIPATNDAELLKGVRICSQRIISSGITSVQDATFLNDLDQAKKIASWKKSGLLTPRTHMMLGRRGFEQFEKGHPSDFDELLIEEQFGIGGVKVILDETTGELVPPRTQLDAMVLAFHRRGFQVAIHAIEEHAVSSACDAISDALLRVPGRDHRHRIEHASVCPPLLARKIASLGITVVTQPSFVHENGDRYLEQVPGERLPHLYPIGSLMEHGVAVAAGSDCPIAPLDPFAGIYSAVTRRSRTGKVVGPDQGIDPLSALKMCTTHAARAVFEEDRKGSVTPGKLADLIVLSGNPLTVPAEEIKEIEVEMTVLDGEVVWKRDG